MSARKVTARRAGAAAARQSLRQFDREIAALNRAEAKAAKVQPLTNTAFGCDPCEECNQLPCQCPVDAWWMPKSEEQELVSRPATIQTVPFTMNGKSYRTASSWSLLD